MIHILDYVRLGNLEMLSGTKLSYPARGLNNAEEDKDCDRQLAGLGHGRQDIHIPAEKRSCSRVWSAFLCSRLPQHLSWSCQNN